MIISSMLNMCFMGVFLSGVAVVCGFIGLHKKDKATERYIARLESENRRLKHTVVVMERKAKGERLVYTLGIEEVN